MNFCSFCLSGIVGKVVTCNVSLTNLFTDFFGKVYEGDKIWKGVDVYINVKHIIRKPSFIIISIYSKLKMSTLRITSC